MGPEATSKAINCFVKYYIAPADQELQSSESDEQGLGGAGVLPWPNQRTSHWLHIDSSKEQITIPTQGDRLRSITGDEHGPSNTDLDNGNPHTSAPITVESSLWP